MPPKSLCTTQNPNLEKKMHKFIRDFEIKTDHLNSARRLDLVIVYEEKKRIVVFDAPVDHIVKLKESEKMDKYHDLARELKKTWRWRWYQL